MKGMAVADTSDSLATPRVQALIARAWKRHREDGVEAVRIAGQAYRLARRLNDRVALAESLAVLSLSRNQASDAPRALEAAEEAVRLCEDPEAIPAIPVRVRMHVVYALAAARANLADYIRARIGFDTALTLARLCGDREREVDALADIGWMYHRQSNFLRALEYLQESLSLAEARQYLFGAAVALNRMGNAYDRLGDYGTALEAHHRGLALRREIGDRFGEASSLGNIGNVHIQMREYEEALSWHEACLALSREIGNKRQEASALGNIGLCYQVLGDLSASVQYHRDSLVLKTRMRDRQGEANSLGNLGSTLILRGEYAEAESYLIRALECNREIGDRHSETHCLIALGRLYERGKGASGPNDDRDVGSLMTALERAHEIGSLELEFLTHEAFVEVYRARGDFENALAHYEEFHRLKETLFTEEMARRTRTIQARHEVEQARKEAEIQRLRNVELMEALAEADGLREVAERLAREDSLTGLLTRRYAEERLAEAFAHALRYRRPLTLVLADVDNFKRINDTCSHQVGDAVLKEVGQLFREGCRATDIAARFGGEEFLLILPETDGDAALTLCERLRSAVERFNWDTLCHGLHVTISMGLCDDIAQPGHEKMLSVADARLYAAKRDGKNLVLR
jgi:diguanylate cyclase (GGDEF)-like protein